MLQMLLLCVSLFAFFSSSMKQHSYRCAGVACSTYDVSSDECDEPDSGLSLPNDDAKQPAVTPPVMPAVTPRIEEENEESNTGITAARKPFYANFKPSCVAIEAIRQHLKIVLDGSDLTVVDTLCSNILCETANRLKNRMACATNHVLRSTCLENVVSHTTQKQKTTNDVVDAMTLETICGTVFVVKLTYTDATVRSFFFQKERAMHTMLSWVKVFCFDTDILKLRKPFSELDERTIQNICFDFIQCVRQALFTLGVSVGSTKREQMYVTGVSNMDTLVYYVSLSDHRIHQGALGKHPLIVYPDRPKVKRKYSQD